MLRLFAIPPLLLIAACTTVDPSDRAFAQAVRDSLSEVDGRSFVTLTIDSDDNLFIGSYPTTPEKLVQLSRVRGLPQQPPPVQIYSSPQASREKLTSVLRALAEAEIENLRYLSTPQAN